MATGLFSAPAADQPAVREWRRWRRSRDPCEVHGVRLMVRRRRKNKDGACLPREHAGQKRAAYTTLIVVRPSNRSGGRKNGAPQRTAAQRGGARVGSKQVLFKSCCCEDASRFWSDNTKMCQTFAIAGPMRGAWCAADETQAGRTKKVAPVCHENMVGKQRQPTPL